MGAPRRRHGLRADVRHGPGELGRRTRRDVRALGDLRQPLALEHNGDMYSCDHFVEPGYLLGNISGQAHARARRLTQAAAVRSGQARHPHPVLPEVRRPVRVPRRLPQGPLRQFRHGEPGLHYLCAGYKEFFRHVTRPMDTMATLLLDGRAPAELMAIYAAQDSRRGRNDPCPCGSSRKWKRCHGAPATSATAI